MEKLLQACLGLAIISLLNFGHCVDNIPGHNKPLGYHKPAEDDIEQLKYFPPPLEFFEKFVLKSKSVVFKGACKDFPAANLWTDEYLRKSYGNVKVSVDRVKVEDRASPSEFIKLGEFLDIYNGSNAYLVDTLPKEMRNDVIMPDSLLCGGFTERLQDVVIWFSSGKSKSHLHLDTVENINCMIGGSKSWFLVDKENTEQIIMDHKEGDYCSVNVDKVDMKKYPFLQNISWWNVTLEQGDCIYVPFGWAHQVSSHTRNIAVNIWWTPMMIFNQTNCQEMQPNKTLSNLKFTPGEQYRFQLLLLLQESNGPVDFISMKKNIVSEHTGEHLISFEDFEVLDKNSDGLIDETEIQEISLEKLEAIFDGVEPGQVNIKGQWMKNNSEKTESDTSKTTHEEL